MSDRKEYFKKYREDNKERIKEYKKEYAKTHDSSFKKLQIKNIDYKQRIDKAIEYINNLRDESAERQGFYNCFPDDLYIPDIDELLSILKGEDKE